MKIIVACVVLAAMTAPAMALDCRDPQAQQDMNQCADRDFQASDAKLNGVYRELTKMLDAHEKASLVEAQRAWIAFRDKECSYETIENEGGSIRPMMISGCMMRMTNTRTEVLKGLISCRVDEAECDSNQQ